VRARMAARASPYIACKPLLLLERQSARETAPQRLPQHTARDQGWEGTEQADRL